MLVRENVVVAVTICVVAWGHLQGIVLLILRPRVLVLQDSSQTLLDLLLKLLVVRLQQLLLEQEVLVP